MAPLRLLHVLKPFVSFLPGVSAPDRKIGSQEKMIYSGGALILYLIASHLPLYGVTSTDTSDPLYWSRTVLGSSRATLMELGVSPLITSAVVLQLLAAANLIVVDYSVKEERALFSSVQKFFALVIAFIQASILLLSGVYGEPTAIGASGCAAFIGQLVLATLAVVLLDELMQKDVRAYLWKAMSPMVIVTGKGLLLPYNLPNLFGLLATAAVFAAIAYLHVVRYEVRVTSNRMRGQGGNYPIKLLYTGAMPLLMQAALTSNVYFVSQVLYRRFGGNLLVQLLGVWTSYNGSRQEFASGGLVYYVSPPHNLSSALSDPLRLIVYTYFTLYVCSYLSRAWVEISGNAPRHLAKIIMPVATLGGLVVGAVSVAADCLGTIGTGSGVIVAVAIIFQYIEIFAKEQQESPFLADLF
ncbi:SecY subunit domain-containing protein [Chytridium lagenaria]|nr:SecY subunit domain-containing protein [Chytridium lagenaria]